MPLLFVGIGILILLVLMLKFRFDAFFALLITSFIVGILNSIGMLQILSSVLKGIGDTMGSIILILVFGAMLGKLIEESGAAHTITNRLTQIFGIKKIQYTILVVGFLVGLPMMYNASFLLLKNHKIATDVSWNPALGNTFYCSCLSAAAPGSNLCFICLWG